MKKLDINGSKLCSYQAEVFAHSIQEQSCSSMIFLRRFFSSSFVQNLDTHNQNLFPYSIEDCFRAIDKEFGISKYGSKKINKDILYWVGYITRYICYTKKITSKYLYENIPLTLFINNYYVYHTQSEEWVIDRILEDANLPLDFFDKQTKINNTLKKLWNL